MPELPEVETTKRGIQPYVEGTMLTQVIVRQVQLRWAVPETLQQLKNATVLAVTRRAKYLILKTNQGDIIGHLGMSGTLRLVDNGTPVQKHDHIDFIFDNGKTLRYNDPRRFGAWLWAANALQHPRLQALGPEPLSENFTPEYLFEKSRGRNVAVKNFLMQNAVVVGVGNIYANEVLFLCGIHPNLPARALTQTQCVELVQQIKQVLTTAIAQGGTTLKDFLQPDGRPGYFAQSLFVYGRKGEPCQHCQTPIESVMIGQRNSFYCPHCQALPQD